MKAMQLNNEKRALIAVELPRPEPGEGELLIRVHAAGVTQTELGWYPSARSTTSPARWRICHCEAAAIR
jgi:NADPH:quinone reductase-like Zn-dependent oxidoreductase